MAETPYSLVIEATRAAMYSDQSGSSADQAVRGVTSSTGAIAACAIEGRHVEQEHRPEASPEQLQLSHVVDDIIDKLTDRYPFTEIVCQSHQVEQDDGSRSMPSPPAVVRRQRRPGGPEQSTSVEETCAGQRSRRGAPPDPRHGAATKNRYPGIRRANRAAASKRILGTNQPRPFSELPRS